MQAAEPELPVLFLRAGNYAGFKGEQKGRGLKMANTTRTTHKAEATLCHLPGGKKQNRASQALAGRVARLWWGQVSQEEEDPLTART